MLGQTIRRLVDRDKVVAVRPQATVFEVAGLMLEHQVGAVVVIENGSPAGIFTERDVVLRVTACGLDPRAVSVGEVMTPNPVTIDPDASFGRALVLMQERGFRHLPVVEDGLLVGMVSARDALDPTLEDFVCEERRRQALR